MFQPSEDLNVWEGVQKHQISGLLYIGNLQAAEQEIENAYNKGSNPSIAIVCCTTQYKTEKLEKLRNKLDTAKDQNKLAHIDIGFGDMPPESESRISDEDLCSLFESAYEFIDNAIKNNIPVLVHCDAGSTRSATLIVAYLMRSANLSLDEAEKRVLIARGTVEEVDIRTQQIRRFHYANVDNFRKLLIQQEEKFHALKPPVEQQPLHSPPGIEPIAQQLIDNEPKNVNTPKLLAKVFQAEKKLDEIVTVMGNQHNKKDTAYEIIYNLFRIDLREKDLDAANNKDLNDSQAHLRNMSQLFLTLIEHKNKIDLHKNSVLDRFVLFKDSSSSWQDLLRKIREAALIQLKFVIKIMENNNIPTDDIIQFIKKQRNIPIFCLHRGNHWYEKFGVTDTVKQINIMIAEYEAKLPQPEKTIKM